MNWPLLMRDGSTLSDTESLLGTWRKSLGSLSRWLVRRWGGETLTDKTSQAAIKKLSSVVQCRRLAGQISILAKQLFVQLVECYANGGRMISASAQQSSAISSAA